MKWVTGAYFTHTKYSFKSKFLKRTVKAGLWSRLVKVPTLTTPFSAHLTTTPVYTRIYGLNY